MQNDPLVEWQRLSENYSRMYDDQLLDLAADSQDLTEQARQVLGDEMRKRGIELPKPSGFARKIPDPTIERASNSFSVVSRAPEPVPDTPDAEDESDGSHEYTWKTELCECEDREEAWQISEMLRQAGIESWTERPGNYSRYAQLDSGGPRIMVAADQLEQAQEVAARPIPHEIIEQSRMQLPEFEPPVCPKCGAGDPVLKGVDPYNTWHCEACENEWTEAPDAAGDEEKAGQ
jgi:hypothetical protein